MKKLIVTAGIITAIIISIDVQAQDNIINKTDKRQTVQRARIADGVATGEVTRMEARQLRAEQRVIRRTENRVEADGIVTRREQRKLTKLQNQASRAITRQKNDAQTRG
ncbi:MAG: hypothetical protein RIC80_22925 [Cyclobacteriaceae bacterium]